MPPDTMDDRLPEIGIAEAHARIAARARAAADPPPLGADEREWGRRFLAAMLGGGRAEGLERVTAAGDVQAVVTGAELERGGALVPTETADRLMVARLAHARIRPLCRVEPMGSLTRRVPAASDVDSDHPNLAPFGTRLRWVDPTADVSKTAAEGGAVTTPKLKQITLTARNLEMYVETAVAAAVDPVETLLATMRRLYGPVAGWIEDRAFIRGNGVGKPMGALASPARITVARAAAGAISRADLAALEARVLPACFDVAVWMAAPTAVAQLKAIDAGALKVLDFDAMGRPILAFDGRRLIVTEHAPALGSAGDLALIDWGRYIVGDRKLLTVQISAEEPGAFRRLRWDVRGIARLDGQPDLAAPVALADGTTASSIVVLGDVA